MQKILSVLVIILLVITIPASFGQEVSISKPALQKSVEVTIDSEGNIHAKHVVAKSLEPTQMNLIDGEISNVTVTTSNGKDQQHAIIGDNDGILILSSNDEVIVEYNIDGVLELIGNYWTWNFRYLQSTIFIFPDNVSMIYSNNRPVFFGDSIGLCHGCQMKLEYSLDEPESLNTMIWEDKKFDLVLRTYAQVDELVFDQPLKTISFQVESDDDFVTTVFPAELLGGPYQVYLDNEKILFHNIFINDTHTGLNFRPDTSGKISIIGTTVIPEFPVALLVLSISILAIIPLARKFNLR